MGGDKRRTLIAILVALVVALALLSGCASGDPETGKQGDDDEAGRAAPSEMPEAQDTSMNLQIGERRFTATLADNSSAEALKGLLAEGPITIDMQDYGDMEKVGGLGTSLPRNDEQVTAEPGDLILYRGNAFVIYYAPNSWSFTRLGRIDDVTQAELREALGSGDVTVTLSLD